jgi:hypothetical protein
VLGGVNDFDLILIVVFKLAQIKIPCKMYPPIIRINAFAGFEKVVIK